MYIGPIDRSATKQMKKSFQRTLDDKVRGEHNVLPLNDTIELESSSASSSNKDFDEDSDYSAPQYKLKSPKSEKNHYGILQWLVIEQECQVELQQ